jgi:hypothetical protein
MRDIKIPSTHSKGTKPTTGVVGLHKSTSFVPLWGNLSKEKGQDNQREDEEARQRSDGFQILFDGTVIGIELSTTRCRGSHRAPANLSFAFLCHL